MPSSSTSRGHGAGASSTPRDPDGAKAFYGATLGWKGEAFGEADEAVTMWRVPGYVGGEPEQPVTRDGVAGMVAAASAGRPQWQEDFWVDDVDATVARATDLGGRAAVRAFDTGIFRQAVIADPAGASFSVSKVTFGADG